ncbi:fork head domain-domain-containing protein, partial [Catenaria anguillulae PL171]
KPKLSYAQLICRAIADSREGKMTLAKIYEWIMDKFPFYRLSESGWQNSVRHNLSTNKCFIKEPRPKEVEGKGRCISASTLLILARTLVSHAYSRGRLENFLACRTRLFYFTFGGRPLLTP